MSNSINNISPKLRDILLGRNIISDTIRDNGLEPLLQGIGIPKSDIGTPPEAVQQSQSIEVDGVFYKDLNTVVNKYQTDDDGYRKASINYLPGDTNSTINSLAPGESYPTAASGIKSNTLIQSDGEDYRDLLTTQNTFQANEDDYRLATIIYKNENRGLYDAYLDENGNLNVGGPSTQPLDVIGSLLQGGGIGFDPNGGGAVSDFDVRSSIAGRVLTATGAIQDTKLGQLAVGYLASAIGNNIAFNLQEETLGRINTNPLSLAKGDSLIVPNFNVTVASGTFGTALDLLERMLGFETPVSLLENDASIFVSESGDIGNFARANRMIQNTGKGQILTLFSNLNSNINPNLIGERNGYIPNYNDDRTERGYNQAPLSAGTVYAYANKLNAEGALITKYPMQLENLVSADFEDIENLRFSITNPFVDNGRKTEQSVVDFIWGDDNRNYLGGRELGTFTGKEFTQKKSILYKTQQLFNSNKMRVLTTANSIAQPGTRTNSAVSDSEGTEYMSKGSGVRAYQNGEKIVDPDNMFCRTWSTFDKYNTVEDLQKHRDLDSRARTNPITDYVKDSVLDDNGFAKISPYSNSNDEIKKFMFSIENLAWADDLDRLLPCEIGPGDLLSNTKGRIMWFPPYEISFNENTSVNWEKNNFIGRGEPIYTYNNTERTGTLSWKIIIDHPNYMNYFPDDWGDDEITSFFAGCLEVESIRDQVLSVEEIEKIKVERVIKPPEVEAPPKPDPVNFYFFFPNDVPNLTQYPFYENGIIGDPRTDESAYIDYNGNPTGGGQGIGLTDDSLIVSESQGRQSPDNTNFGLNGFRVNQTEGLEQTIINGVPFPGWTLQPKNNNTTDVNLNCSSDPNKCSEFWTELTKYMLNECKYCKIKITGKASPQGSSEGNRKIGVKRAEEVKKYIETALTVAKEGILDSSLEGEKTLEDLRLNERIFIDEKNSGEVFSQPGQEAENAEAEKNCPTIDILTSDINNLSNEELITKYKLTDTSFDKESAVWGPSRKKGGYQRLQNQDTFWCKLYRRADVILEYDEEYAEENTPPPPGPTVEEVEIERSVTKIPVSRFFSECNYFQKMEQTDRFVYDSIKEKIKYFHPSFHSITPEGFNSRLTFLQQCTRQGPTKNNDGNPNNLAFGRPPVCILRIGDFYHTKIIIESISFDYDPMVWDLNPEGIGVQPMVATVNMNFAFIGGSSLKGPINKLQNAISFNYFANTEIYDPRADRIAKKQKDGKDGGSQDANEYELVPGIYPTPDNVKLEAENEGGAKTDSTNEKSVNQETIAENENTNNENTQSSEENLQEKNLRFESYRFNIIELSTIDMVPDELTLTYTIKVDEKLDKEVYNLEIDVYNISDPDNPVTTLTEIFKGSETSKTTTLAMFIDLPEGSDDASVNYNYALRARVKGENPYTFTASLASGVQAAASLFN
jgi:hypothetical protein